MAETGHFASNATFHTHRPLSPAARGMNPAKAQTATAISRLASREPNGVGEYVHGARTIRVAKNQDMVIAGNPYERFYANRTHRRCAGPDNYSCQPYAALAAREPSDRDRRQTSDNPRLRSAVAPVRFRGLVSGRQRSRPTRHRPIPAAAAAPRGALCDVADSGFDLVDVMVRNPIRVQGPPPTATPAVPRAVGTARLVPSFRIGNNT